MLDTVPAALKRGIAWLFVSMIKQLGDDTGHAARREDREKEHVPWLAAFEGISKAQKRVYTMRSGNELVRRPGRGGIGVDVAGNVSPTLSLDISMD